jgi:hypothetical protein
VSAGNSLGMASPGNVAGPPGKPSLLPFRRRRPPVPVEATTHSGANRPATLEVLVRGPLPGQDNLILRAFPSRGPTPVMLPSCNTMTRFASFCTESLVMPADEGERVASDLVHPDRGPQDHGGTALRVGRADLAG